MNFDYFVESLPIMGQCILGVFASIGFIILVIYLLNKSVNYFEARKNNNDSE